MAARRPKNPPPTSTLVLLVRHGQTPTTGAVLPGRARGLHLSDTGRAQAEAAATRIAAIGADKVAAVYASPLERARETAAPIGLTLGRKVAIHRGLLECEFGEWTGRSLADLRKLPEWTTVQRHPSAFRFPGGESFAEMQGRISETVRALAARHVGATIVAVSHADPIKAAIADASGAHLDAFQRFVVSTCSITAIAYDTSGGAVVLATNSTGSLLDLVPS